MVRIVLGAMVLRRLVDSRLGLMVGVGLLVEVVCDIEDLLFAMLSGGSCRGRPRLERCFKILRATSAS